jgi:hypothetical protein
MAFLLVLLLALLAFGCRGEVTRVYDDELANPSGATTHFVGGVVHGLAGMGLVLRNNNTENLSITENGVFAFQTPRKKGEAYSVMVVSQPAGPTQACTVTNGAGSVGDTNVATIDVSCETTAFNVSGTTTNLTGAGLTLQLEAGPGGGSIINETVRVNADGSFTFPTPVPSGYTYVITVTVQPASPNETCKIGTLGTAEVKDRDITTVAISCLPS